MAFCVRQTKKKKTILESSSSEKKKEENRNYSDFGGIIDEGG